GIIEVADEAAELRAAASGIEISAFGKEGGFGNARCAAMSENLNDAGNRVGAVDRGLGAAHDFDFVNVVEREVGEVHGVAVCVYRVAVDQDLAVGGAAAIEEDRGRAAFGPGATDGNAGRSEQRIGQCDREASDDFFADYHIDGSGGLLEGQGLSLRGDDDARREAFEIEAKIKGTRRAGSSEVEIEFPRDEGLALKCYMIGAGRKRE